MIVATIQVLSNVKRLLTFYLFISLSTELLLDRALSYHFVPFLFCVSRCPCHSLPSASLSLISTLDSTTCRCLTCLHVASSFCSTCSINRSLHLTATVHELSEHERLIGLKIIRKAHHSQSRSSSSSFSPVSFLIGSRTERMIKEFLLSMSFNYNPDCARADDKQTI